MSTIPIPYDSFIEIDGIKWITCRNWATGGSAESSGFVNSGILNDPLSNLWGNTKYLKVKVEDLREEFDDHLTDTNAHSTAIANRIEAFMANWILPAQRIKASLSEDEGYGLTNDDIEGGAEILESKLHLDLRGKTRPALIEGADATYAKTGDLAQDIMALFRRVSAHTNSFSLSKHLGEALMMSGWATPIPLIVDQNAPGAFKVVGNRIAYVHDKDSVQEPSLFVKGIPVFVGSDPITTDKDFIGTFLMDCGSEPDESFFVDLSSSNMTEYTDQTRQDMVFIEFWMEDIPQIKGRIVPFGNTFYVDRNAGYDGVRYRQTSKGLVEEDPGFETAINTPSNLVFTSDQSRLVQFKCRIRMAMGKSSLSECAPQGHLSIPVDIVLDQTGRFYATAVDAGSKLKLTVDNAELYTGNIVKLSGSLPTGLQSGTNYYVIRPSGEGNSNYIQLAANYDDCYSGIYINIPVTEIASVNIDLSVNTHSDVPPTGSLTAEDLTQLFDTFVGTSEQWDTGTPVSFYINDSKVKENLPEFFDDATYYVDQVRPGWIAIYKHSTEHDPSSPLVQVAFTLENQDPIAGMIVLTSDKFGFTEEVKLCSYALDNINGYLRSSKEWGRMHPIKITKKETISYIFTKAGEILTDSVYYVARVLDENGNYEGILVCDSLENSLNSIGMKYSAAVLAENAVVKLKRSHVFSKSSKDPSCWQGFISVGQERTDVLALPLFSIHRRNAGIFHPVFNPNGSAMAVRGTTIATSEDCFRAEKIATYNPDTKEFGTWAEALSLSQEEVNTRDDIENSKILADEYWSAGTEVQFDSQSGSLPGGIEQGKRYWVLTSVLSGGRYEVEITAAKGGITPVTLIKAADVGTMNMYSATENFKVKFKDPDNPDVATTVFRTGYSGHKEKGFTSAGLYYGLSGRPDGLYYDVASTGDIVDLRNQLVLDGVPFSEVLARNLDLLFRGANVTVPYNQKMSDGSDSGIKAPCVLHVDTLDVGDSVGDPTLGAIINHRKVKEYAGNTLFSNDFTDGLRRFWSDAPIVQNEADLVVFGDALNELPSSFLDLTSPAGLGQIRTANFSHSLRLGDSVSPKRILDIDFYVLKYRSLEDGGSNKLALVGVKLARGGEASGDFEGAETNDDLRTLTFEANTLDSPYRVLDIHSETAGEVTQSLKTDMQVKTVTVLNNGRSVDVEVVPFRIPKPLTYGSIYYLFEHPDGNGYYRLATSLRPSSEKESINFVVDSDFFPNKLYELSLSNTSTKSYDNGIAINPVFATKRDFVRRNVTLNVEESYLALNKKVTTGTTIKFSFPDKFFEGLFTYALPPVLSTNETYYAIEDGRVKIGENYFYKVRLAYTSQDAVMGNYFSFVGGTESNSMSYDEGDLFFVDIGSTPFISIVFDYPNIIRPLKTAGVSDPEFQDFSVLETGCPITINPNGCDKLPKPFSQYTVYYVHKISNQEAYLCTTPQDAASGTPIELLEEGGRHVFTINPGVYYMRNVMIPPSPVLFTGSDGKWNSGAQFRMIDPNSVGLMYLNAGVETEITNAETLLFYTIELDSRRFRAILASGSLAGVTAGTITDVVNHNYTMTFSAPEEGVLNIIPVSIGARGRRVDVTSQGITTSYLQLLDVTFPLPVGAKVKFTEASLAGITDVYGSELPPVLNTTTDYFLVPRTYDSGGKTQNVELALTYNDAYNAYLNRGNVALINLSEVDVTFRLQIVGFPTKMFSQVNQTSGLRETKILVSSGKAAGTVRITKGTPVYLEYYSDVPTYMGRGFPEGLSRNRLYFTSEVDSDGYISLYDSIRDVDENNPILFDFSANTELYFLLIPAAVVDEVEFSSDHRLNELQVPNDWPYSSVIDITGIPLRIHSTVLEEQFPIISGIYPNRVYYAVRTSEDKIGLCRTFAEAVAFGNSDLVSLSTKASADIDTSAYLELVPQPTDALGDPLEAYTFSTDSVNMLDNTIRISARFLSGTPVYFNPYAAGSLGEDIQINSTYYVVVRRIVDQNAPTLDICLVDTLEASHIYESRKDINSVGDGMMKVIPLNKAEIVYTAGNRIVVLNSFNNSWLRNTIQTSQDWITSTPVKIQNVGEGLLPQYYEYGNEPSLTGETIEIPVNDVEVDLDTLSDSEKDSHEEWDGLLSGGEALKVNVIGNDIPTGMNKDQVYYICGVTKRNTNEYYFKLAPSFQDAFISVGTDIKYVVPGSLLALSSWVPPELEMVSLGSGYIDLTADTIRVQNTWPSGIPIKLVPSSGSTLPVGLSTTDFYFTYAYGPNQIQLIEDLRDYYRFRFGGYSAYGTGTEYLPIGSASVDVPEDMPRIVTLSDVDTTDPFDLNIVPIIDSFLEGGDMVRIWVERAGELPDNYTQIDKIKFGTVEVVPDSGDYFKYEEIDDNRYILISIPSYPQDSIVEISLRKKTTSGDYLWSPPVMFVYTSAKMPILIRVTPATVHADWESQEYVNTIWNDFAGKVSVVFYAPNGFFEDQSVAVQLRNFAVGNTKPLPENQDIDYIVGFTGPTPIKSPYDLTPGTGYLHSPFFKIEFDYILPVIEHINDPSSDEVLVMNTEVSLVTNDTDRSILSLNTLALTNLNKLNAVEVPFFVTLSAQKAYSSPGREMGSFDFNRDLVFGRNSSETIIRMITPGFSAPNTMITFEDVDTGTKVQKSATVAMEYWNRNDLSETGTKHLVEVLYVSVPRRLTSSHTVRAYFSNNPDVPIDVPYIAGSCPFIGHESFGDTKGGIEVEFRGDNLDSIDHVFLRVDGAFTVEEEYKRKYEASIIKKTSDSVSIVLPPLVYHSIGSGDVDRKVEFEFCSSTNGSTTSHFTYSGELYSPPVPTIDIVSPSFLFGEVYDTNKVRNLQGTLITILGSNLTNLSKVTLTNADDPGETYEITNLSSDVSSCWFNMPDIQDIALTTGPVDVKYKVKITNSYGASVETISGGHLKIKANDNYVSMPTIASVYPLEAFNSEDMMIVLKGNNLADTTSVLFGSQYINAGQFSVTPGIGGAQDTVSFFSRPNSDKGMIPVVINTYYGGSIRLSSYPAYFFMKAKFNASIQTEGSGDFEIQVKSWETETFSGTSRVYSGKNLLEITQNLPAGLPVRITKTTGHSLPNVSYEDGRVFYVVKTDLRRVKLVGKRTGSRIPIRVPGSVSNRAVLTLQSTDNNNDIITFTGSNANWANGQEVYLVFSGAGSEKGGLSDTTTYWVSNLSGQTLKLLDSPSAETAVDITATPDYTVTINPILGSSFTLVDLPIKTDPLNPANKVVDWDQGIARYFERVSLNDSFSIDTTTSSMIVRSRFWDSSKTIGMNPYYPPFLGDQSQPLPMWARTTEKLPTESTEVSGYLFAREDWDTDYESGVSEELEYQIEPMENVTYFVGLSDSFIDSISQNPKLVALSNDSNMGFTLEVVDEDLAELFQSAQINPAIDEFRTIYNLSLGSWVVGMPVVLGSQLPEPLEDNKIYYNAGDSTKVVLAESLDDIDTGTHVDLTENKGFGFFRLTPTYPELNFMDTYYVEDVGNGRIRLYKSLKALLDGSYLRFTVSNETEMLVKPVPEIDVLSLESSTFDLETNEILNGSSNIVSGMPIKFEPYDETTEMPEGIESGQIYYVYRSSPDVFSLFDTWREVALLEGHTMHLAKGSSAVTMKPDFTGERVLQTISGTTPNIVVSSSKIKLTLTNSHSDPQGTPVMLVSDVPVLGKDEMLEEGRGIDIRFHLRYADGCGLTDRAVNVGIESRKGTELPTIKTTKDCYVVVDPRRACESKGYTSYWRPSVEDVIPPMFDIETLKTYFNETPVLVTESRWNTAIKGFFHALDLMDAIVPGPISLGEIVPDRTTITMGVENSYMGFDGESASYVFKYDDFLPGNLKGHDLYIAWIGMRIDKTNGGKSGTYETIYNGFPITPIEGRVSYSKTLSSISSVVWNKQDRTITFTGLSDTVKLTFRVGLCSVDYTNNSGIPPYSASTYSGVFDVGYIYKTDLQCKEVALVGAKRVLRSKDFGGAGYGFGANSIVPGSWYAPTALLPENSRGFTDACGFSWTAWKQKGSVDPGETPVEFDLVYTKPTDAYFEGEGDLYFGSNAGESTELLYFAGWDKNPIPAIPVKPSDGRVYVYYDRNPVRFDHSITPIRKLLPSDYAILTTAGSGNYRPATSSVSVRYQYPFLTFHIPTPDPTSSYRITGKMIDPDTYKIVSNDSSFVRVSVISFNNPLVPYPMDQFGYENDTLFTPEYAPKDLARYETRMNGDETSVLIPGRDPSSVITTYPVITSRGSEMLTILPNLFLDERELKGVLLVHNGNTSFEARFRLHGRPVMRSNLKGL